MRVTPKLIRFDLIYGSAGKVRAMGLIADAMKDLVVLPPSRKTVARGRRSSRGAKRRRRQEIMRRVRVAEVKVCAKIKDEFDKAFGLR